MAKAVKKKAVKLPEVPPEAESIVINLSALNSVLERLKKMVEGPGTVADRQALYDDLQRAINEL